MPQLPTLEAEEQQFVVTLAVQIGLQVPVNTPTVHLPPDATVPPPVPVLVSTQLHVGNTTPHVVVVPSAFFTV